MCVDVFPCSLYMCPCLQAGVLTEMKGGNVRGTGPAPPVVVTSRVTSFDLGRAGRAGRWRAGPGQCEYSSRGGRSVCGRAVIWWQLRANSTAVGCED